MAIVFSGGTKKIEFLEDFPVLCRVLGIPMEGAYCDCVSSYTAFDVKARGSRKTRRIDAPCPHLKAMQRLLLDKLLVPIGAHDCAMGFAPGKSIAINARRHHCASHLFTTDIRSFFPSIKAMHISKMLKTRFPHLSKEVREEITCITTRDGRLPQGAPTSPHIANLVMYSFDELCEEAADRLGAVYTRYADDISISSHNGVNLRQLESVVRIGLDAFEMEMHPDKTRHLGPRQTKLVTGLDIGGTRIRPTKAFRKKTAALVRMSVKYQTKMERHRDLIRGYLAFWYDVDPIDPQLADLLERMGCPHWASKARSTAQGILSNQKATTTNLDAPETIDFDIPW